MKIVHFSDWHWQFMNLPTADLYVCTGDMYQNYPFVDKHDRRLIILDKDNEIERQTNDVYTLLGFGGFRQFLGSPDAPIICVRGNHDFIDLSLLFSGCNLVHEFIDNDTVEIDGKVITGHRGVPTIDGRWMDETNADILQDRVRSMQNADIFLTHYPPYGVLDSFMDIHYGIQILGVHGMADMLMKKMPERGLHCFGHIHECGGQVKEFGSGRIIGTEGPIYTFSNAACTYNVIEL